MRRLASPRFFMLAPLLVHYDGALHAALLRDQEGQQSAPAETSVEALAAMTDHPRLPGISYSSGGG